MPALERFQARDGTGLGVPPLPGARPQRRARWRFSIHGSSGSSDQHPCAGRRAGGARRGNLCDRHSRPWRLGHARRHRLCRPARGRSRRFRRVVRKTTPDAPLTLIGHSAGGGFALRVAGSPIQNLFARTVLLAPYLGYHAPTNRPNSGGWASADVPRILGLTVLRRIGIDCCEALPVLAFAVPPNSEKILAPTYTDRLMRNFANHRGLSAPISPPRPGRSRSSRGADDELMLADKYAEAVRGLTPPVDVKLIDGVNHMGIVSAPKAVSVIADDVATRVTEQIMIDSQQASEALARSTRSLAASGSRGSTTSRSLMHDPVGRAGVRRQSRRPGSGRATPAMSGSRSYVAGVAGSVRHQRLRAVSRSRRAQLRCPGCWRPSCCSSRSASSALLARPFHAAPAGHVLADLFHAGLYAWPGCGSGRPSSRSALPSPR